MMMAAEQMLKLLTSAKISEDANSDGVAVPINYRRYGLIGDVLVVDVLKLLTSDFNGWIQHHIMKEVNW